MRALDARVDPEALQAGLAAGRTVLVLERPALFDGVGDCGGEMVFDGFVAAPNGVESVTVEIADRGSFQAEIGLQRPDARLVLADHPGARRPGFRLPVDTSDWAPGTLDVTILVRALDGHETVFAGRPRWFVPRERFVEAVAAGDCGVTWVDPLLGTPVGQTVYVGGCAASRHGIASVEVDAPGIGGLPAWTRVLPPHAAEGYGVMPGWATAYGMRLDLAEVEPGRYPIAVTATDGAGQTARQHGTLIVDPAERYRLWLASRGRPAAPEPKSAPRLLEEPQHDELAEALHDLADDGSLVLSDGSVELAPDAVARLGAALEQGADVAYGDEEVAGGDGAVVPLLKPGWSPELLLAGQYVGSVIAFGPAAARQALGGWDGPPADGRQLMLRLVDAELDVVRVPEVLARRRDVPRFDRAGEKEARSAVARERGRTCTVQPTSRLGIDRVRWPLEQEPLVTVVIPTLGRGEPLGACLASLAGETAYENWEAVLVDSGDGGAERVAAARMPGRRWQAVRYEGGEFNFSRAVNQGADAGTGELVLYLNDDTTFPDPDWLGAMVEYATLPGIGAVGPLLLDPGGTVQCAGVLLTRTGARAGEGPLHAWRALPPDATGPNGELVAGRDVAVLSGACTLVPRSVAERAGGWDERFRMDYGDIDLCLRIRELGLRVVCVPWSRVLHLETATRPSIADDRDRATFHDRWGVAYADGDPWHHPAYTHAYEGELRLAGVDA